LTLRRLLLTSMLVSGFAFPAMAEDFTKEQIEAIIHDYILKNPQVLIDSVNNYERDNRSKEEEKAIKLIKENADWLYKNKIHQEAGNPKGKTTIVEFFDYNCGYCKQAVNDMLTLIDEDKDLRLIFVEIPILGDSSVEAAKWALAAGKQDQYLEYHIALMRHKGSINAAQLEDYAKKVGLDVERLKKDMKDPKIQQTLDENLGMARLFGVTGTPAFIVGGDVFIRGYVGVDGMRQAIKDTRVKAATKKD